MRHCDIGWLSETMALDRAEDLQNADKLTKLPTQDRAEQTAPGSEWTDEEDCNLTTFCWKDRWFFNVLFSRFKEIPFLFLF